MAIALQHSSRAVQCPRQSGAPFRCRVQQGCCCCCCCSTPLLLCCLPCRRASFMLPIGLGPCAISLGRVRFARRVCLRVPAPTLQHVARPFLLPQAHGKNALQTPRLPLQAFRPSTHLTCGLCSRERMPRPLAPRSGNFHWPGVYWRPYIWHFACLPSARRSLRRRTRRSSRRTGSSSSRAKPVQRSVEVRRPPGGPPSCP